MIDNIFWFGHSSLLIKESGRNIYIDPWKLSIEVEEADLVLITHSHHDHCSPGDIKRISRKDTVVVGPYDALSQVELGDKRVLGPGKIIDLEWVKILGVPAYNVDEPFHPRENRWLGFLINLFSTSIYIAGDTSLIPEMNDIKADIVILPVGGKYTMDARKAAIAVNRISPGVAIPIHYGDIVGSDKDAEEFASLVKSAQVKILPITK